jgi:PST family polysaccharide transporter
MSTADGWGRSVKGGIFWSTASFVATKALSSLTLVILARLLVPSQFGLVAAIAAFVAFVQLGSDLGMRATVVYEQERGITERIQTAFTLNIMLVACFTALAVLLSPLIAEFFHVRGHADLFRLGSLNLLIVGLGNVHDGLLLRELAFRRRIIPEVARGLVSGAVSLALAFAGFGALALVAGLLTGSAAWTTTMWRLTRFRPTWAFDRSVARNMIGYGLGASVLQVVAAVSSRFDIAVIGRVVGSRGLGLYTVGFRVPELLIANVGWNVSTVAFPALARYQALYTLPVAIGLAILAPALVVVLFSAKWRAAGGVMSAIAIMNGIQMVIFPLGDVYKATGRQWILITLNLIQLPLLIVGVIVSAPAGILVVAWVRTAGMVLFAAMFLYSVKMELGVGLGDLVGALRPALCAAAGVGLGAGVVRLAWNGLSVGPLAVAAVAGLLGGLAALRGLAPGAYRDVRALVGVRSRPRVV